MTIVQHKTGITINNVYHPYPLPSQNKDYGLLTIDGVDITVNGHRFNWKTNTFDILK